MLAELEGVIERLRTLPPTGKERAILHECVDNVEIPVDAPLAVRWIAVMSSRQTAGEIATWLRGELLR